MRISTELYNREVLLCVICKENPSRERIKTCSPECSKAYQKASKKAYHKTDKSKAYQKAYRKTDKFKAYKKAYYLRNKIARLKGEGR